MQNLLGTLPFNISLLILKPENLKGLQQIKVLDIFEASSSNFHPDGLFSIEIFGKVGDAKRNRRFGYMDLGVDILHPVIFKELCALKELYKKIMEGTAYAVFNEETKDFDQATSLTPKAGTGFSFFLKHFKELKFEERNSTAREFKIKLINKHRDQALMNKLIVMPAGLRDFTVAPTGKSEEDEINTLYRSVLSISNVVVTTQLNKDLTYLDSVRYRLQQAVMNVYTYIINLLEGDSKLIQSWWTSRNIFNSTRNVITSNVPKTKKLYDELTIGPNDTVVGLYQYLIASIPLTINMVREYSQRVFSGPNTPAKVVNRTTLRSELVSVNPEYYDAWVTQEGLERTIGHFEVEGRRDDIIMVEGGYFGLIYRDGKRVKFLQDIDDVPEDFDKKFVKPITYSELYYLAVAERSRELYSFVTRYPIIGLGGIYPSSIYLKTTTKSESLQLLNDAWELSGRILNEFPINGVAYVNSMSVASSHLSLLDAD